MKLSRRSWFIITLGFYIMVTTSLFVVYFQHAQERAQLEEELASARSRLSSVKVEPLAQKQDALEENLNQAYEQYEADKEKFAQSVESIVVSNVLYSMASANSVNITEMRAADVSNEEVQGVSCLALTIDAKVEGYVTDLAAFITQLNSDLTTAVVKSVNIDIPPPGNDAIASAAINVVVYTHEVR
jgi:low temperature requirement protein LtrA